MNKIYSFLVRHSVHRICSGRNKHEVAETVLAAALTELKRDGYTKAHDLMQKVMQLAPGETLELSEADRQALRVARGSSDNAARAIGRIPQYGTVTRA